MAVAMLVGDTVIDKLNVWRSCAKSLGEDDAGAAQFASQPVANSAVGLETRTPQPSARRRVPLVPSSRDDLSRLGNILEPDHSTSVDAHHSVDHVAARIQLCLDERRCSLDDRLLLLSHEITIFDQDDSRMDFDRVSESLEVGHIRRDYDPVFREGTAENLWIGCPGHRSVTHMNRVDAQRAQSDRDARRKVLVK